MNDVKGQLKEVVEGHVQGSIRGRNTRRGGIYLVNYVTVKRHRVTLAESTHSHASDAK